MLVCPAVFKTVAGGEELPRWVRFPHTLANGNRSGSAAPVFVHFNPSVKPSVCQLPVKGSLLALCKRHPKAVPVYGESVAAQAVTKGERLGDAKMF